MVISTTRLKEARITTRPKYDFYVILVRANCDLVRESYRTLTKVLNFRFASLSLAISCKSSHLVTSLDVSFRRLRPVNTFFVHFELIKTAFKPSCFHLFKIFILHIPDNVL